MSSTRRTSAVVAVTVLLLGVAGTIAAHGESEATSFQATASAEGVRIGVAAPNFVVVDQLVDVGVPVAQSTVDGLGNSKAFASNPYPGELAISGPGTIAGLTGLPNPGNYPLYAATSYPTTTEAHFSQPNYDLSAKSAEQSSDAVASAGGSAADSSVGAVKATATSRRAADSGAVSAEAISTADAVNLAGGALRIGAIRATAKVTRRPGAVPVRSSSLSADGVSVAGQSVGFNDKGFVVAGTSTPIPDDSPVASALAGANISVRYLKGIADPDGVVSPGLVITQRQQVPQGPTLIVTYVFGRAVAHASLTSAASAVAGAVPIAGGSGPEGVVESPGSAAPAPIADVGGAGSGGGSNGTRIPVAAATPLSGAQGQPTAIASTGRTSSARLSKGGASTASIYVILIIGAVIALGGGQLLRMMGVRMAWTS
jgi:hypothetical protein